MENATRNRALELAKPDCPICRGTGMESESVTYRGRTFDSVRVCRCIKPRRGQK